MTYDLRAIHQHMHIGLRTSLLNNNAGSSPNPAFE